MAILSPDTTIPFVRIRSFLFGILVYICVFTCFSSSSSFLLIEAAVSPSKKSSTVSSSSSAKNTIHTREENDDNLVAEDDTFSAHDQPQNEFTDSDVIDEKSIPRSSVPVLKQIFQNALVHVPPNLHSAMLICRSQRLTADDINEMRFTGAYLTIDKFMLFLLPAYPEFISVLACLVENNLITNVYDAGALLLYVATERKHISLTTALITRNASIAGLQHPVNQQDRLELSDTIPYLNNEINSTIFHTALQSRILVLDIVQNLLKMHGPVLKNQSSIFYRQMLGQKVSSSTGGSPPSSSSSSSSSTPIDRSLYFSGIDEATVYPKWLISMVQSMQKHLPEIESMKVSQALTNLLQDSPIIRITSEIPSNTNNNKRGSKEKGKDSSKKNDENSSSSSSLPVLSVHYKVPLNLSGNFAVLHTVDTRYAQIIANGLSTLLLRLILEAPGATYHPNATTPSQANDGLSPPSVDEQLFPHRLSRIFVQDGLGRTPLHIAAMNGNVAAIRILLHYVARTELASNFRTIGPPAMKLAPHLTLDSMTRITSPGRIEAYIMTNDVRGLNALDYACIYGHDEVVDLLIFGPGRPTNTEKHVLSCSRWTGDNYDPTTKKTLKRKPLPSLPLAEKARTETGGWNGSVVLNPTARAGIDAVSSLAKTVRASSKTNSDCQIDTVNADISAKQFFEFYYIPNRPVAIRGLALDWSQRRLWDRSNLLQSSGKVKFLASNIPYSTAFGIGNKDAETRKNNDEGNGKKTTKVTVDTQGKTVVEMDRIEPYHLATKAVTIGEYIQALYGCGNNGTVDPLLCTALGFSSVNPSLSSSSSESPLYIFDSPIVASTRGITVDSSMVKSAKELVNDVNYVPSFINYEISKEGFSATYRVPPTEDNDDNDDEQSLSSSSSSSSMYYSLVQNYPTAPKPQFYLGSPGTGAPMHIHKDAWNALIYGQKRWFLLPPALALYSTVPASEWVQDLARVKDYRRNSRTTTSGTTVDELYSFVNRSFPYSFLQDQLDNEILQCTQEPGDVLYVPHGWGHAVVNTETSIGVAVEFSTLFG